MRSLSSVAHLHGVSKRIRCPYSRNNYIRFDRDRVGGLSVLRTVTWHGVHVSLMRLLLSLPYFLPVISRSNVPFPQERHFLFGWLRVVTAGGCYDDTRQKNSVVGCNTSFDLIISFKRLRYANHAVHATNNFSYLLRDVGIRRNARRLLRYSLLRWRPTNITPLSSRHITQIPLNSVCRVVLQLAYIALLET